MKIRLNHILAVLGIALIVYLSWPRLSQIGLNSDSEIHIAFGVTIPFLRFDESTESQIRLNQDLRRLETLLDQIENLEKVTKREIPITWTFESIELIRKILEEAAPNSFARIVSRIQSAKDDVNITTFRGESSALMTRSELKNSLQSSISNSHNSGLEAIFGRNSNVFFPQFTFFNAENTQALLDSGIEYIATSGNNLYQSNPLTIETNGGGSKLTGIPTYDSSIIHNAGSIRRLIFSLRKKQLRGDHEDKLLYINFDIRELGEIDQSSFKFGYTYSIGELITSIWNKPHVKLTNLTKYLESSSIRYKIEEIDTQITPNLKIFTQTPIFSKAIRTVDRLRKLNSMIGMEKINRLGIDFDRMESNVSNLLNLRHFGPSGFGIPNSAKLQIEHYIENIDQYNALISNTLSAEARFPKISKVSNSKNLIPVENLVFVDAKDSHIVNIEFANKLLPNSLPEISSLSNIILSNGKDEAIPGVITRVSLEGDRILFRIFLKMAPKIKTNYTLSFNPTESGLLTSTKSRGSYRSLSNSEFHLAFSEENGFLEQGRFRGEKRLPPKSFLPNFTYSGVEYLPTQVEVTPISSGALGLAAVRISGSLSIPNHINSTPGFFETSLILIEDDPRLFVDTRIQLPKTDKTIILNSLDPKNAFSVDPNWGDITIAKLPWEHVESSDEVNLHVPRIHNANRALVRRPSFLNDSFTSQFNGENIFINYSIEFDGNNLRLKNEAPLLAITMSGFFSPNEVHPKKNRLDAPDGFFAVSSSDEVFFHWSDASEIAVRYKLYLGSTPGMLNQIFESTLPFFSTKQLYDLGKYYAQVSAFDNRGMESAPSKRISFHRSERNKSTHFEYRKWASLGYEYLIDLFSAVRDLFY